MAIWPVRLGLTRVFPPPIPWTAVNLVDYYVVRRGHYPIAEIFKPTGHAADGASEGSSPTLIGVAAMTPFFNVGTWRQDRFA
jgi:nucleobase:cation symporter-1, NCS1 family